jgi:hypothetical protein
MSMETSVCRRTVTWKSPSGLIDVVAQFFERHGNVVGGDRSEQLIVLAGLLMDRHRYGAHHLAQLLRLVDLLGLPAEVRLALLLHDLLVGFIGRYGQVPRQQEIARVPGSDLHHIAALAQFVYVFSENNFHNVTY